jgi:hypothetical protein
MAAIRVFFFSQSKRVSQLEDAFADRFGAIDIFFFHSETRLLSVSIHEIRVDDIIRIGRDSDEAILAASRSQP